jgi:acetylornithine/N-succinyldiaminopimelate aminotransferase
MPHPAGFDLIAAPVIADTALRSDVLMHTYSPAAVEFVRGLGTRLWDSQGHEYLDAIAGVGVTVLGQSHPAVVEAITAQAGQLLHVSNLYSHSWRTRLAGRLTELSRMDRVFFGNSGAEANEAALKLARLHARRKGIEQPLVVVMENAFHGRTLATLSASDSPSVTAGFAPLVTGYLKLPFGDLVALEAAAQRYGGRIVAVLVEPIQGEGGVHVAPDGYLKALRACCNRHDWLLMLDEIQTGLGRTGQWFAFQHEGIRPDVLTLAKGLANGVPIGACLAAGHAADLFTPGSHGSTFGGNLLACRVACTVLDIIEQEGLVQHAAHRGQALVSGLQQALADNARVREVRGRGLMVGIELDEPCTSLALDALHKYRLLVNVTRGRTIRLLPPLVLNDEEVQTIVRTVSALLA